MTPFGRHHYFHSLEASALGLTMLGIGHMKQPGPQWVQHQRTLACFGLNYLVNGKGYFESQLTERQEVAPGQCMLLFPGVWHRYAPLAGSHFEIRWLLFEGSFVETMLHDAIFHRERPVLDLSDAQLLLRLF